MKRVATRYIRHGPTFEGVKYNNNCQL